VSKKQHQKQLQRARQKRRQSKFDRRTARNRAVIILMAVLLVLSLVAAGLAGLIGGNESPLVDDPLAEAPPEPAEGPCPSAQDQDVPQATDAQYDEPPPFDIEDGVTYVAVLHTTCGDIELTLDTEGAPATAANFLGLSIEDFYEGVPFHRTILEFMIQGGDPLGEGTGGPGYQIDDELDTAEALGPAEFPEEFLATLDDEQLADIESWVTYPSGILAMANSGPNTAGSQFFIVHADSPLPPAYTVFGEVAAGMEVVDDIARGPTGGPANDEALDPVYITGVTIERR
jgi:cyclophilin family peptidyl-prolyl cis-trans isomerase